MVSGRGVVDFVGKVGRTSLFQQMAAGGLPRRPGNAKPFLSTATSSTRARKRRPRWSHVHAGCQTPNAKCQMPNVMKANMARKANRPFQPSSPEWSGQRRRRARLRWSCRSSTRTPPNLATLARMARLGIAFSIRCGSYWNRCRRRANHPFGCRFCRWRGEDPGAPGTATSGRNGRWQRHGRRVLERPFALCEEKAI